MMTINYHGTISILLNAVNKANELLSGTVFYDEIAKRQNFDFTTASGLQIAESMKNCPLNLEVFTFKKPFTKVLGYENPFKPTSIYINIAGKKLNRSLGSIVGTYIHEAVHAADANDEILDYPHNGNSANGNEQTAPYVIGNLAVQLVNHPEQLIDVNNLAQVVHAPDDEMEMV